MSTPKHRAEEPENPTLDDVIHGRYVLSVRDQILLTTTVLALVILLVVGTIEVVQALLGWS